MPSDLSFYPPQLQREQLTYISLYIHGWEYSDLFLALHFFPVEMYFVALTLRVEFDFVQLHNLGNTSADVTLLFTWAVSFLM